MTPIILQDALVDEVKDLLSNYRYRSPLTPEERVPMNVYPQAVPINPSDDEDIDPIPYIIVRLNSGDDPGGRESFNTIKIVIIIGIWDDNPNAQGHRDVLNIIQKIYERFQENPNLRNKAVYAGEFHWALQEDGYFPYHFGACSMNFNIAAIRREDRFA